MIYSYFTADNLSKTAISTADNSSNFPYDNCGDESMAMAINQAKARESRCLYTLVPTAVLSRIYNSRNATNLFSRTKQVISMREIS